MKGHTRMRETADAPIVAYLLGELSEEDRTRLEERLLRDAEYRELIRAIEDDLIDDYVHGDLTPRQRELFERHFTSLPQRRRKVELAKVLSRKLSEHRAARSLEPARAGGRLASVRRWFTPGSLWAHNLELSSALAAAVLVFLAAGVWFIIETDGPATESATSQAEPQPLPPRSAPPSPAGEAAAGDPAGQPPRTAPPQPFAIATIVLAPGQTRDGAASTTFLVPTATELVRLQLPLESGDLYPAYRAELRTASGDPVWRSDLVKPASDPAEQSVVLDLPPDLLQSARYELTLTGVDNDLSEDIGYYHFSVVRK
jgi:hypothetical protein